jgi:putative redox protein
MAHVTVISDYHFIQQIVSGRHRLTADEPVPRGGSDSGPAPHELLLASLGACTSITLRMYAGRKDWELGKITVGLRYTPASENQKAHIERRLSFSKPLRHEQTQRLLEIAGNTPVTLMLMAGVAIDTSIIETSVAH